MQEEIKEQLEKYYDFWFTLNDIYEKWAKQQGLTFNSLFTLFVIDEYPNCTQKLICEKILLPKQTVNTILTAFEKKGYIKKEEAKEDKRNKYIILSQEGKKWAQDILSNLYAAEKGALENMSSQHRLSMIEGNQEFLNQLKSTMQ